MQKTLQKCYRNITKKKKMPNWKNNVIIKSEHKNGEV